ncbi:hypothetical protein Hdeb2414_s0089g00787231 [Helianthus debilis subsp. tardiflorus]
MLTLDCRYDLVLLSFCRYDLVLFWPCFGLVLFWFGLVLVWSCFGFDLPINGCKSKGVKWSVYKLWV